MNLTSQTSNNRTKTAFDRKEVTFNDLNNLIAHKLGSVLQPCTSGCMPSNYLGNKTTLIKPKNGGK